MKKINDIVQSTKKKFHWFLLVIGLILLIYSVSLLIPFVWGLITSLKTNQDFLLKPMGLPEEWKFENYRVAFNYIFVPIKIGETRGYVMLTQMFGNSILYSFGCAFMATITPCVVAYLVQKYPFKFGKYVYTLVLVTMVIPIIGSLPSEYALVQKLGFQDNMIGMWLMKANFLGTYFLILYASWKGLSNSYMEAAFVDGASHWRVFLQIMLPMLKTQLLVVFVLNFITFWNDYQIPMLYMPNKPTAAYGLYYFSEGPGKNANQTSTTPMKLAGAMVVTFPILIFFIIFKDKLIGNLTIGGLKG